MSFQNMSNFGYDSEVKFVSNDYSNPNTNSKRLKNYMRGWNLNLKNLNDSLTL